MSEGTAAIIAAGVGFLAVTVGAIVAARFENKRQINAAEAEARRQYQALVRAAAYDFLRRVVRIRQARLRWENAATNDEKDELRREMEAEDHSVRYEMDRLRLTVNTITVQQSAREVVRLAHGLCREVRGLPARKTDREKTIIELLQDAIYDFIRDVRSELGLDPAVFEDPPGYGPGADKDETYIPHVGLVGDTTSTTERT